MSIDVSRLQVSMEEGERWRRTLSITVPSELVQKERQATVKKLSSQLKLPGFRAGKIPPAVVEKRFGPALEQELVDRVVGEAYRGVLREQDLRPISEGQIGNIDYEAASDLSFEVSFDVAPEVELARLGGFTVERPVVEVTDAEVDRVLDRVREQEGTWVPKEGGTPEDGDRVSVRIKPMDVEGGEPQPYEFVLGKGEALPDVEEAIRTLEVGASGDFTVDFPEHVSPEEREGAKPQLHISLDARKELELPELNDALAAAVGDFETLDELRDRIREDLHAEAEREAEAQLRGALLEQVLAANDFDIPESMIDQYVRSALGDPENLPEERLAEAKEQFRSRAETGVKRFLVVDRIAQSQGLAATEKEVDDRIEEIATKSEVTPTEVYTRLQKSGQLEQIEREITETKVFDYLKEQSEIVEPA